jgi:hypothetical protein
MDIIPKLFVERILIAFLYFAIIPCTYSQPSYDTLSPYNISRHGVITNNHATGNELLDKTIGVARRRLKEGESYVLVSFRIRRINYDSLINDKTLSPWMNKIKTLAYQQKAIADTINKNFSIRESHLYIHMADKLVDERMFNYTLLTQIRAVYLSAHKYYGKELQERYKTEYAKNPGEKQKIKLNKCSKLVEQFEKNCREILGLLKIVMSHVKDPEYWIMLNHNLCLENTYYIFHKYHIITPQSVVLRYKAYIFSDKENYFCNNETELIYDVENEYQRLKALYYE